MNIPRWHYGKLILLWAWGAVLTVFALYLLQEISSERFVAGTLLILAVLAIPIALSVITWKWLGGKERPEA